MNRYVACFAIAAALSGCDALTEHGRSCGYICDTGASTCAYGSERSDCIDRCEELMGADEDQRQQCADCVADVCLDENTANICTSSDSGACFSMDSSCSGSCGGLF